MVDRGDGSDLVVEVRVQARASRSEFAGLHGRRIRVRLQEPPVDGRANAALVDFLARALGVSRSSVTIEHGLSSRDKRVRIRAASGLAARLQALLGGA